MTHLLETIKVDLLIQIEVGEGEYIGHCSAIQTTITGQSPAIIVDEIKKVLSNRERLSRDEILAKKINKNEPQKTSDTITTIDRPAPVHRQRGRPRAKGVGA